MQGVSALSANPSIRKNFSWTALGNIVYAACQWGIITVLAKLGTPEMVGQFALALALTGPVVQFANLQLRGVQATDAKQEYDFFDYLTLRTFTTAAALMICFGIAFFGHYDFQMVLVISLVAAAKGIDAFSDLCFGMFQQHERMDVISKALIANGVLSLFLVASGLLLSGGLIVGVLGYVIGSFLPFVLYVVPWTKRGLSHLDSTGTAIRLQWKANTIFRLATTALPLGIVMLLGSLNANVPRYFIDSELGARGLGIFAALAYLIVTGTTVVSALGQAASPRLSQYYATDRVDMFRTLLVKLIVLGLVLGAGGAVCARIAGDELLSLLYTEEYSEYGDVLVVLALAAGLTFAASFAGYGMTAARYFGVQVPVSFCVLVVSVLASAFLIPAFGLIGASFVMLSAAAVQLVAALTVVIYALRKKERGST